LLLTLAPANRELYWERRDRQWRIEVRITLPCVCQRFPGEHELDPIRDLSGKHPEIYLNTIESHEFRPMNIATIHQPNRTAEEARRGAWWDANKIGLSPPPIETSRGWLVFYHGVRHTPSGCLYRLGLALFDLENPEKCLLRGDSWIFGLEASYERHGDVDDVVFPCGYTMDADGDTLNIYYGAADCAIALARASVRSLLEWLDANGSCERRQRAEDL
jgi:hypothetical protein